MNLYEKPAIKKLNIKTGSIVTAAISAEKTTIPSPSA